MPTGNILTEQARKRRSEYLRQWRAEHPEKQREYNARYWVNKVDKERKQQEKGSCKQ